MRALVALFLFAAGSLHAQSYLIRNYTEDDGLPSSTVHDLTQDDSGRMWFATRSGIAVYDGAHWMSYTVDDGLRFMSYFKIAVDEGGTLWAFARVSPIAASSFDGDRWSTLPAPEIGEQKAEDVFAFAVTRGDGEPVVAIGTREGLFLWHRQRWRRLTEDDGLAGAGVNALAVSHDRLYVGTTAGLCVVEPTATGVRSDEVPNAPAESILGVSIERLDGESVRIWLLGERWIGSLENQRFRLLRRDLGDVPDDPGMIALEPDGTDAWRPGWTTTSANRSRSRSSSAPSKDGGG